MKGAKRRKPDGQETIERIGSREVAAIMGEPVRTVQAMAARGKIPSAAQLLTSRWTFNEAIVRAWITEQEERHVNAVAAVKTASRRIAERPMRDNPIRWSGKRSTEAERAERAAASSGAYEQAIERLRRATSPPDHFDKNGRWIPAKERRAKAKRPKQ